MESERVILDIHHFGVLVTMSSRWVAIYWVSNVEHNRYVIPRERHEEALSLRLFIEVLNVLTIYAMLMRQESHRPMIYLFIIILCSNPRLINYFSYMRSSMRHAALARMAVDLNNGVVQLNNS